MLSFTIPKPPSANNLYANVPGKGRVKTRDYKLWLQEAGWVIRAKRLDMIEGAYHLRLSVSRKRNKDGSFSKVDIDLGNALKATEDALQAFGVIENDKFSQTIFLEWTDAEYGMRVTVSEAGV